ncbi:hypothetical protein P4T70_26735 [Bacillus mobilis]|uniref:hypothetical protein n=1 Tax=Bacillus cereus group TaxID=86661 RepID=UPI0029C3B8D9|nr:MULTISPECIES: hypothetical protein [Bacillus cereus group]MDX5808547.1 hypothetical protein [Bacillus cereus group sp. BfR-BA-02730]MED0951661.1 hypothetical protein [Bacillus mobilis]
MFCEIVELDMTQPFGDLKGSKFIKEVRAQSGELFKQILLINGKIYHPCVAYSCILGVREMKLNKNPENHVISEEGLECPYCEYVHDERYLLKKNKGHMECQYCHSEIKFVIDREVTSSRKCLREVYHTEPVKLKEPIEL